MEKFRESKTQEEIDEFERQHTIGFDSNGIRILDCTFDELVEGTGGVKPEELWNYIFDELEKSWDRYRKLHIPPFSLYRSTRGKYGLLNHKGFVCGNAKYSYCKKKGYENYLEDEKGNIFEFNPNEGLIPIS